ncbi:MAG: hypothetical protein ACFE0O_05140 [Opitutales bacterium]
MVRYAVCARFLFPRPWWWLLGLLVAGSPLAAEAAWRTFTDNNGRTLRAEILDTPAPDKVTIRRDDGRVFRDLNVGLFSADDQAHIRQWREERVKALDEADLTPDARLDIRVLRRRDDDLNNYGNIDDREVAYLPRVRITNEEVERTFTGVKGTLVFVGESVLDGRVYKIIDRQSFTLDLPRRETTEWTGKPFENKYDDDGTNGYAFGYKYEGYLLVLKNRQGQTVQLKASRSAWEKRPGPLLRASTRSAYDGDFLRKQQEPVYTRN